MNILKIILFGIVLNFAIGLLTTVIPAFDAKPEYRGGLPEYDTTYNNAFIETMDVNVASDSDQNPGSNFIRTLYDSSSFKYVKIIITTIDQFLFGFVLMLQSIFAPLMYEATSKFVFGWMRAGLLTFYVIIYVIDLIMNRNIKRIND